MAEELQLPPHIVNINGAYFNKLNNRWIGDYKIKQVCDAYWALQEAQGQSSSILQSNGTIAYKTKVIEKPKAKPAAKQKFKTQSELVEVEEDYGIVPNPNAGQEFSDDIFDKSASVPETELLPEVEPDQQICKAGEITEVAEMEPTESTQEFVESKDENTDIEPSAAETNPQESHIEPQRLEGLTFYANRNGVTKGYLRNLVKVGKIEFVEVDGKPFIDIKKYPSVIFEPINWTDHKKPVSEKIIGDNIAPITKASPIEVDIDNLLTIQSAAKILNHTAAYIYQLLQKGSLEECIVDGVKFVTKESIDLRRSEYDNQNARLKAERASAASRDKKIAKVDHIEMFIPLIEMIHKPAQSEKSDAEKFFESPIYENSVSFMFSVENHNGLNVIIQSVCDQWKVDFEYMKSKVHIEKIPDMDDVWYEEIMAMICHALWVKLPIANRIDWLSGYLNRTPIQVKALLGIYWREEHTKKGNWYRYKDNDTSWWEWAHDFDYAISDYFLPFYRFDYTYKYCEKTK